MDSMKINEIAASWDRAKVCSRARLRLQRPPQAASQRPLKSMEISEISWETWKSIEINEIIRNKSLPERLRRVHFSIFAFWYSLWPRLGQLVAVGRSSSTCCSANNNLFWLPFRMTFCAQSNKTVAWINELIGSAQRIMANHTSSKRHNTVPHALHKFGVALALLKFSVTRTMRDMFSTINAIASSDNSHNELAEWASIELI